MFASITLPQLGGFGNGFIGGSCGHRDIDPCLSPDRIGRAQCFIPITVSDALNGFAD